MEANNYQAIMGNSNTSRAKRQAEVYGKLISILKEPTKQVVQHLKDEHSYTYEDIGKVFNPPITRQAVQEQYFKEASE